MECGWHLIKNVCDIFRICMASYQKRMRYLTNRSVLFPVGVYEEITAQIPRVVGVAAYFESNSPDLKHKSGIFSFNI